MSLLNKLNHWLDQVIFERNYHVIGHALNLFCRVAIISIVLYLAVVCSDAVIRHEVGF